MKCRKLVTRSKSKEQNPILPLNDYPFGLILKVCPDCLSHFPPFPTCRWNPPIRRIPPLVLTRFLADLGLASASPPNANSQDSASSLRLQHLLGMRALATRGRDGGFPVMAWSHRVFAARTRTLYAPPHSSTTANLHAALAEYFAGKWAFEPKPYTTKEVWEIGMEWKNRKLSQQGEGIAVYRYNRGLFFVSKIN